MPVAEAWPGTAGPFDKGGKKALTPFRNRLRRKETAPGLSHQTDCRKAGEPSRGVHRGRTGLPSRACSGAAREHEPNLAARYLSLKRNYRISVNTLKGTTSFWDQVRAGIEQEAKLLGLDSVELDFRTFPRLALGEREAFEAALKAKADGIIAFPSHPQSLRGAMRRAAKMKVPVVCVATDAPDAGRLAVVSIDTAGSGALAADLLGRMLNGKGKVATTLSDPRITEHAEKCQAFADALRTYYPAMQLVAQVEDHDVETEAYDKCRALFREHPDLQGIYITTEASIPVLDAARDAGMLSN